MPPAAQRPDGLARLGDLLDLCVDVLTSDPVGDDDLGHATLDHAEGKRLARGVHVKSFANPTEPDVLALAEVERSGIGQVEHLLLIALHRVAAEKGLDIIVEDVPDDFELDARGAAVLRRPGLDIDLFGQCEVFSGRDRNDLGVIGFVEGGIEEGVGVKRHDEVTFYDKG